MLPIYLLLLLYYVFISTKTKHFSWKLLPYTCLSKEDLFLGIIDVDSPSPFYSIYSTSSSYQITLPLNFNTTDIKLANHSPFNKV